MKRIFCSLLTVVMLMGYSSSMAQSQEAKAVLKNIATRTSVRAYTDRKISKDDIEKILRAGMAAPTARNIQPWHFVVVDNKQTMIELSEKLPYAKMLPNAACAIVVCGDVTLSQTYWQQDCSAATENILLAAHALGIGAVWTGAYPGMERANAIGEALNLPSHIKAMNVIVMGYPKTEVKPKDKWKPEKVHYNKW